MPRTPSIPREEVRRLVAAGLSPGQCRRLLGCSDYGLRYVVRELGLQWRYRTTNQARAEFATWDEPQAESFGVVPASQFVDIFGRFGCVGTANYLGISPAAVSQRAKRLRTRGLLTQPPVITAPEVET